uniref:FXYD domain-containing ion transport regulator n=1 Tax=Bursaphelenchus xylophilus TaxID=6326 RepID=A0A1I7SR81_BURXY
MPPRRACFPTCKPPEKRDFMQSNPELNATDFYRNYDPVVGIGTVGILMIIILMVSLKSIIRCSIQKYKLWTYDRKLNQVQKENGQRELLSKESSSSNSPNEMV